MSLDLNQRPNVLPWPPIIFGALVIAAVALIRLAPWPLGLPPATRGLAGALILAGVALDFAAIFTMYRANTNIMPHRGADRLVDWGPFAYSRNPIYTGNTLALFGFGLWIDDLWLVAAPLVGAALIRLLAIRREEAHLEARFGDAWRDYARRTPRWLGWPKASGLKGPAKP